MKSVRSAYLVYVMVLAFVHLAVTVALWGTPALVLGVSSLKLAWFVALFGGWILAGVADLVLSMLGLLPLTFAGEAALANACLAIMAVLNPGFFYLLCATLPPVLVLIKGVEEFRRHDRQFHAI
jgi:hypothetical protein